MEEWHQAFEQLKGQYVARSGQRLEQIDSLLSTLAKQPDDMDLIRQVTRHFHWLAGSGAIYDMPIVSDIGSHGEKYCDQILNAKHLCTRDDISKLHVLIETARNTLAGQIAEKPEIFKTDVRTGPIDLDVVVIEQNDERLRELTGLLEDEGFLVREYRTPATAQSAILERRPKALLLSAQVFDESSYEIVEVLRAQPGIDDTVVFFVNTGGGKMDKIRGNYVGVDAMIEPPLAWDKIAKALKELIDLRRSQPYRVLSVEDDPDQSNFIRAVLQSIGCMVETCSDPAQFTKKLESFDPELLLLDVMLGELTGFDLAEYVRKDQSHASLPIIFLTTQTYIESKIKAFKLGAEDFLAKPVTRERLAAAVSAKIERSRTLAKTHDLDGLTQIKTFSAFVHQMQRVLVRRRAHAKHPLTLAIIDIDGFKDINERLGYAVGDQVLCSLANVLKTRLRPAILARHGGDSIVAAMESFTESEAIVLMGRLCEKFSSLSHKTTDGMLFSSTICAGISELRETEALSNWIKSAERALATARTQGRGSIVGSVRLSK